MFEAHFAYELLTIPQSNIKSVYTFLLIVDFEVALDLRMPFF